MGLVQMVEVKAFVQVGIFWVITTKYITVTGHCIDLNLIFKKSLQAYVIKQNRNTNSEWNLKSSAAYALDNCSLQRRLRVLKVYIPK